MNIVEGTVEQIPVDAVDLRYERLRLVRPREYARMRESIERFGQLHAVSGGVSIEDKHRYALVDGFKRYRACVDLCIPTMILRVVGGGIHALKAAIITLNCNQSPLHVFEEAMVVTSLYRDDKLSQQQIATLFGRHKSWSCRRIAICERLCDDAIDEIRLGILGFATARQLCRLPRGNQREALRCIHKHHLTSHEAAQLASLLLQSPPWNHPAIIRQPLAILDNRQSPHPLGAVSQAYNRLIGAQEKTIAAVEGMERVGHLLDDSQRSSLLGIAQKMGSCASRIGMVAGHVEKMPQTDRGDDEHVC